MEDLLPVRKAPNKPSMLDRFLRANPFYSLVVLCGTAFLVSACGYTVMAFQSVHAAQDYNGVQEAAAHPLMRVFSEHGATLMASELALLAVAMLGAMGTDRWWYRRQRDRQSEKQPMHTADAGETSR